jgi:single-strand DNA-binding protein
MLNHITIMGRLTKDVELRRTNTGTAVASFTLAVDRDFGEKETDFIEVVAWRQTAEFVSKYFSKGRMAVVSGRLQIRKWNDKDGNKRSTAEVVADNVYFGDSKNTADNSAPKSQYTSMNDNWHDPNRQQTLDALGGNFEPLDETDFGLPF